MTSILLHACCAPCAAWVANQLREQRFEVEVCWYNPNIHPFTEHQKRLESIQVLSERMSLPIVFGGEYEMVDYFRAVVGREANRCPECYRLRLGRTAKVARERGFDAFSTTLLISPYQNQEMLKEVGEAAGRENAVDFYYEDFRPGFRESHRISRDLGLYHQKYCGCVYSEWERYRRGNPA